LVLAVIRGALRPLSRKEVLAQVVLFLDSAWTDVTSREVEAALDAADLDGIETDLRGRYFAEAMATELETAISYMVQAGEAIDALEETEGADSEAIRNRQVNALYKAPLLTSNEERLLGSRASHDDVSRNALIEANTRLARSISGGYAFRATTSLDDDDLFQEACLGLIRAAQKFDTSKGFKFSTYATWWLRQSVGRAVADKGTTIRLPVHICERLNKLRAFRARVNAETGTDPSAGQISRALGLTLSQVEELKGVEAMVCVSIESMSEEEEFAAVSRDPSSDEYEVLREVDANVANRLLAALSEREAGILRRRLGLDGDPPRTLEAIGDDLGLTRERVRQIESQAKKRIRTLAEETGWGPS
jgi:RNA polymerase sigma factor (sigma-70 family)